jgi:hypothetical protein
MSDLSRDFIRELFGIRFDVKNSYSITFDQIRDYVQKSYTTQLKYIFDYTKQNQSSDYFYNIRKRLEIANNYSKGEINNRYPNIVSLFETTNMDIFIRGRGKTSIDTLNEDITNKTLSHIEVKGTEQILEFVFL